jgi:hypothetical protein
MLKKILSFLKSLFGFREIPVVKHAPYPRYIEFPNEIDIPLPGVTDDMLMYNFVMEGDYDKMQRTVDQRLNAVIQDDSVRYFVLSNHMIAVLSHIRRGAKPEKDYPKPGLASEKAFQIFIPMAECMKNSRGEWVAQRMTMFIPYILLDNFFNLITGREQVGFPKSQAWVTLSDDPEKATEFKVDAFGFKVFDHQNPVYGEYQTWMTARQINRAAAREKGEWKTHNDAWDAIKDTFKRIPSEEERIGLPFVVRELEDLAHKKVDLVFLKQFRDVADPLTACYQAITDCPGKITRFYKGWWMDGVYEFEFEDFASFPIAEELGLPKKLTAKHAFWCLVDMAWNPGTEIYRAS